MIVRPLELASRLRSEPRNLDWLFFVNAGLLVLFFSLFGSRFVLAPGLKLDLPQMEGSDRSAVTTTHHISVTSAGVIFIDEGPVSLEQLKQWLKKEGAKTKHPALLVRASQGVNGKVQTEIVGAAAAAGFTVQWAAEEPPAPGENGRR
jgi:biopolymer transport protein ExbD